MISFKRIEIKLADLLVEVFSVVVAILLALAANNWLQHHKDEALLHRALLGIRSELSANAQSLAAAAPAHRIATAAFERLVQRSIHGSQRVSFNEIAATVRLASPNGFHKIEGETIAWQIAQNSDAVSLMDYAQRATLTRAYQEQAAFEALEQRYIDQLFSPSAASGGNFFYAAVAAQINLEDLVSLEGNLQRDYSAALDSLRGL